MTEEMKSDDLKIRNYFRNQIYDQGFYEVGLLIQQKYASVAEALALRQELLEKDKRVKLQEEENRELKRQLFIYKAKYQKTKAQKQELLEYYKRGKRQQLTEEMIRQSEEYLKVLTSKIEDLKNSETISGTRTIEDSLVQKDQMYVRCKEMELQLSRRQTEQLKIQCSMQQRLIQARARFSTQVYVKINPADQRFAGKPFQILDEPELGLAKQLLTGQTISFVDFAKRLGENRPLPFDICNQVLSSQSDIVIGVIGEPQYNLDPTFTVLQEVFNELIQLSNKVRDVTMYYRNTTL